MTQENATTEVEAVKAETNEAVQAAYDRIANPGKVQEDAKEEIASTAETPLNQSVSFDDIKELKAQVSRIPELEKRLRDEGGRYGILKQSLEQIQQRISDKQETSGSDVNVDDVLADIKRDFGEDELYKGLKTAFSKLPKGRDIDPGAIEKIISDKITEAKEKQFEDARTELTELRPTWEQDRETPEFAEWFESQPTKVRDKLRRSKDPDYLVDRFEEFDEWKSKKSVTPAPKEEAKPIPSKRLTSAVLPTNGAKPKAIGDDKQAQVRAAYERVAGNRR